ncbi:MAG: 3D domain-containing protein [Bacillota bacterium]|nr:3D domain-containing protein [Bacillota bacterium]
MKKRLREVLFKRNSALLFLAIINLLALTLIINQTSIVRITDDGKTTTVKTMQHKTQQILSAAGIKVSENDLVDDSNNKGFIKEIVIKRAYPIHILCDGKDNVINMVEGTVDSALKKAGITLTEYDYTDKKMYDSLYPNINIQVSRVRVETVKTDTEIPYDVKRLESTEIPRGKIQELVQGKNGISRSVVKNIYVNDALSTSQVLEKSIVTQPVTAVLQIGTGGEQVTSRGDAFRYNYYVDMEATAYTYNNGSNITATGKRASVGRVAVDPTVIPLGTRLYISYPNGKWSYGYAVAEDTGGAIKGKRIDLFLNSENECRSFGRRTVRVYILDN